MSGRWVARAQTRGLVACASLLAVVLVAPPSAATGATFLSDGSRVAALANAVSARPGDTTSMLDNPAGLGDLREPVVTLSAQGARLMQSFQRQDEDSEDRSRFIGGFGLTAGTPLPYVSMLRFGVGVHVPAQHALRVTVTQRTDEPTSVMYDGRPEHVSALGALAIAPIDQVRFGMGLTLTPVFETPSEITYAAGRGDTPDENVVTRLERDLQLRATPLFGVRVQPIDTLGFALVYRRAAKVRAGGKSRTVAGAILADDPIDYGQFWDPETYTLGAALNATDQLTVSLDTWYARWSERTDAYNEELDRPLGDVLSARAGVSYRLDSSKVLRAGYGYEPTPLSEQIGHTNYLGANTHVVAFGGGIDLRPAAPLALDAHLRARIGEKQTASKDPRWLHDADPETPGKQIENLGYPGFESRSVLFQAGFTLSLFVGAQSKQEEKP